uniref:Rho GTPase activating protein 27 n=1 Tax=Pelodiscus sinensis TaxID=13735 RepID=K7FTN3_PELSI
QAAHTGGAPEEECVLVEYEFEYVAKDGTLVSIKPNERYVLLRRTNSHWWHVRKSRDARPFYIPAKYVKELPPVTRPPPGLELPPEAPGQLGSSYSRLPSGPATARGASPRLGGGSCTKTPHPTNRRAAPQEAAGLGPPCSAFDLPAPGPPFPPASSHPPLPAGLSSAAVKSQGSCASFLQACEAGGQGPGGWNSASPAPLCRGARDRPEFPAPASRRPQVPEQPRPLASRWASLGRGPAGAWPLPSGLQAGPGIPPPCCCCLPTTGLETPHHLGEGGSMAASGILVFAPAPLEETHERLRPISGQVWGRRSGRADSWSRGSTALGHTGTRHVQESLAGTPGPGAAHKAALSPQPPTPETDYPDLSPEELDGYPEEDYSPVGSYEHGAYSHLSPEPGWYSHNSLEGQAFYLDRYASAPWPGAADAHGPGRPGGRPSSGAGGEPESRPFGAGLGSSLSRPEGTPVGPRQPRPETVPQELPELRCWGIRGDSPGKNWTSSWTVLEGGILTFSPRLPESKGLHQKNWTSSWTVLEGGILTFFKESKHLSSGSLKHPSMLTTPEHTVDLRGAVVSWAPKEKSSKKNVLELKTRDGSEFLIQHDSEPIVATWQKAIADSIGQLTTDLPPHEENGNAAESGAKGRLGSYKEKEEEKRGPAPGSAPGSLGPENDTSKVRNRLLLRDGEGGPCGLQRKEQGPDVPVLRVLSAPAIQHGMSAARALVRVCRTISCPRLDIDGLYRISGNLATIQKLRYKVDHARPVWLAPPRWRHLQVTKQGGLLYWHTAPGPALPGECDLFFPLAAEIHDQVKRSKCICDLVWALPEANHDTMRLLFQHLCRLVEHKEQNRMSVQSVAIVFGPTLLRPERDEGNMAMHMVFQNQIVELILNQTSYIFPGS